MSIQFQCAACSQPIEIDSEWGGKLVACPYCRKTVTAPAESTYYPPARIPTAQPVAGRAAFEAVSEGGGPSGDFRTALGNAAAVWAMLLTCGAVAALMIVMSIFAAHFEEIRPFVEMAESGKSRAEVSRAFVEHVQGAVPGWLALSMLLALAAAGLWLAGLICGLIAVRRTQRRRLAVASLILSGVVAFLTVSGA